MVRLALVVVRPACHLRHPSDTLYSRVCVATVPSSTLTSHSASRPLSLTLPPSLCLPDDDSCSNV